MSNEKVRERASRQKAIRKLARKGLTAQQIADELKVSSATVYNEAKGVGVDIETPTSRKRREIAEFCKSTKLSMTEVSSVMHASRTMIIRACSDYGVPLPSQQSSASVKSFEVLAELMAGKAAAEVAAHFGVTVQRVNQIKTKAVAARILGSRSRFEKFKAK